MPSARSTSVTTPCAVRLATLKAREGEEVQWWKVLAFGDSARVELLRLEDGDALSVQGGLRAEAYEKDGEPRVSLTVLADAVLPLRQEKKQREPGMTNKPWGAAAGEPQRQEFGAPYDDPIPF
jgi:single-stranded DNA-binding protein